MCGREVRRKQKEREREKCGKQMTNVKRWREVETKKEEGEESLERGNMEVKGAAKARAK